MNPSRKFFLLLAALLTVAGTALSQSGQLTVIKAGRLIDPETGTAAANQMILIDGEKIMMN